MHLIKDENGNLVQHGHGHTHEHTHEDGMTHTHEHTHGLQRVPEERKTLKT